MSILWQATIICTGCGKQYVQGPMELGPRDELSIGGPPPGWQRIEASSSDKVLPRQMDGIAQILQDQSLPQGVAEAQLNTIEMACPDFYAIFDYCEECLAKPETLGMLGLAIQKEQQRLLEIASEEFEEDNVIQMPIPLHVLLDKENDLLNDDDDNIEETKEQPDTGH